MRKSLKSLMLACLLGIFALPVESMAGVRVYLRFAPPPVRTVTVVRQARPYHNAIWVSGHWRYNRGHHVWVEGRWIKARRHYAYVQPHWVRTPRGFYFVTGHWVRN